MDFSLLLLLLLSISDSTSKLLKGKSVLDAPKNVVEVGTKGWPFPTSLPPTPPLPHDHPVDEVASPNVVHTMSETGNSSVETDSKDDVLVETSSFFTTTFGKADDAPTKGVTQHKSIIDATQTQQAGIINATQTQHKGIVDTTQAQQKAIIDSIQEQQNAIIDATQSQQKEILDTIQQRQKDHIDLVQIGEKRIAYEMELLQKKMDPENTPSSEEVLLEVDNGKFRSQGMLSRTDKIKESSTLAKLAERTRYGSISSKRKKDLSYDGPLTIPRLVGLADECHFDEFAVLCTVDSSKNFQCEEGKPGCEYEGADDTWSFTKCADSIYCYNMTDILRYNAHIESEDQSQNNKDWCYPENYVKPSKWVNKDDYGYHPCDAVTLSRPAKSTTYIQYNLVYAGILAVLLMGGLGSILVK